MNGVTQLADLVTTSAGSDSIGLGWMALYAVIGFVLVIVVLVLLIVLLAIISKIVRSVSKKGKTAVASKSASAPAAAAGADSEHEEVVAAVTAALMAYYGASENKTIADDGERIPVPFVIRSIRKI